MLGTLPTKSLQGSSEEGFLIFFETNVLGLPTMAHRHFVLAQRIVIVGPRCSGKVRTLAGLARARASLEPDSRFVLLTAEGVVESPFCGKFWDGMREAGRLVTFSYFHDDESAWRQYVAEPQCVFLCLGMRRHPTPLDLHVVATCKTMAVFQYILGNKTTFDQHPRDVVWCLSVQGAGVYRTLFHDKLGASLRTREFPALRSGTAARPTVIVCRWR